MWYTFGRGEVTDNRIQIEQDREIGQSKVTVEAKLGNENRDRRSENITTL